MRSIIIPKTGPSVIAGLQRCVESGKTGRDMTKEQLEYLYAMSSTRLSLEEWLVLQNIDDDLFEELTTPKE